MINRTLAILLLLAISFTTVVAQEPEPPAKPSPSQQDDVVRVSTAAVQIDVVVTDRNGRHIKGLTSADFQIVDEGAPQAVDLFMNIEGALISSSNARTDSKDGAPVPAGSPSDPGKAPASPLLTPYQGRHIALVFDDLTLSTDNSIRAKQALSDYVNTKTTPNDQMAVISTGGQLGTLQQFTNDKQQLLTAINRISTQAGLLERLRNQRVNISLPEAIRIDGGDKRVLDDVVSRILVQGPESTTTPPQILENQVRVTAKDMVSQLGQVMRINLRTLANLFRGMAALPGRKVVVLMTEAFIIAEGSSEDVSNQLTQLIDLARRSGVSVYALDAGGLRTNSIGASEQVTGTELRFRNMMPNTSLGDFEKMNAARALTAATGGDLIANTNALMGGIDRAVADSSSYYVLGFRPRALDNKFHHLTISIKGRPELVVRTRRGYLALNQETAPRTEAELAAALISPVARIDLPLEVVANVVPKGGEQIIQTGVHVGRNYLTLPDTAAADQTVAYEVLIWVFAAGRDEPVGVVKRRLAYELAKDTQARERLKREGLVLVSQFTQLAPGNYQIRAVVREESTGYVGSAYQFFEVPDVKNIKAVSLSSLVLTPGGQTGFSGYNSFKRGSEMDVRYIIYNLPKTPVGLVQKVRLIDPQGKVLMDSELPLAQAGTGVDQLGAPQGTRIKVPAARGRYALIVSLHDPKGKMELERRANLVVE